MNRIKSKEKVRLSNSSLNSLMHVCSDDSTLESYNPQPAVNHWSKMVHCRPGARKERATCNDSEEPDSDSEYSDYYNSDNDSDIIELPSEHDSYDSAYDCDTYFFINLSVLNIFL